MENSKTGYRQSPSVFLIGVYNKNTRRLSLFIALVFLYFAGSVAIDTINPDNRLILIRYFSFIVSGFFAFVIPHLRFPDSRRFLIQSLNLTRKELLRYLIRTLTPVCSLFVTAVLLFAFLDIYSFSENLTAKLLYFLSGAFFIIGMCGTSLYHYLVLGKSSQEWQEGRRGQRLMESMKNVGTIPSVPPGSFPSLMTTTSLTTFGMLSVVGGAYLSQITGILFFELLPGVLFIIYSLVRFKLIMPQFDRFFYQTNAFFQELFLNPRAIREGREPLQYDALYWVPKRWKAAVWFSLLQLDRKQPLGRLLIAAHLVLWALFYSGVSPVIISTTISLIIVGKCLALYRLISKPFAPLLFQYRLLAPADWIFVRFFVNLRWIPLLALSLWLVSLFSPQITGSDILYWVTVDVAVSLISAALFTIVHEFRIKSVYA